jgi:hypothetical protein
MVRHRQVDEVGAGHGGEDQGDHPEEAEVLDPPLPWAVAVEMGFIHRLQVQCHLRCVLGG